MGDIDGAKEQKKAKVPKAIISVPKIAMQMIALAGWTFVVDTEIMENAPAEINQKIFGGNHTPPCRHYLHTLGTSSYKVPNTLSFIHLIENFFGNPQDPNIIDRAHFRVVYNGS